MSHFYKFRIEIGLFLLEQQFHVSNCLNDFSLVAVLAHLPDIFTHLNMLSLNLQGEKATVFQVEDRSSDGKFWIVASSSIKLNLWNIFKRQKCSWFHRSRVTEYHICFCCFLAPNHGSSAYRFYFLKKGWRVSLLA